MYYRKRGGTKVAKALKTILRKGYLSKSELLEVFNEDAKVREMYGLQR